MESLQSLITELQHPDRNVRSQAAVHLGNLGDADALPDLLRALYTEPDFFVREDITWAVTRLGEAAVPPLLKLLTHANPAARYHAAHVLGKLKDGRAVTGLLNALHDADVTIVAKAAFALGQIGDDRALPALITLSGREERELQTTVNTVLEGYGASVIAPLLGALTDARWAVRVQAADVLGLLDDASAVPALIEALTDDHWQVRFAVVTTLGHLGGAPTRQALMALPEDPDLRVRELVTQVLKRMKR